MGGLARGLASFIRNTSYERLEPAVIASAERVIADTFAAILSGAGSELVEPILTYTKSAGRGDLPILGSAMRSSPEGAALANGAFGAALDFDDVLSMMPGHPSAVIVPALLAVQPIVQASGRSFIEAYAIGIEVGAKMAVGLGLAHYKRGFHATGTVCLFSALAALVKLRGCDEQTIVTAFNIAASMSSGLQANFGTMTKGLHSGLAARSAVAAVEMAMSGVTAAEDALDGKSGFFQAYGAESSRPQTTLDGLGKPWVLADPGIALKKYSCCYATHRAIDALQLAKSELKLSADSLASLTCRVAPGALTPLPYPRPKTGLESKFSMDYSLAAGVVDDAYSIETFTDKAAVRPAIAAVMDRITVVEDLACVAHEPDYENRSYGSRGTVLLEAVTRDGRSSKQEVRIAPGHPARALTWADLEHKFRDCVRFAGLNEKTGMEAFPILRILRDAPSMDGVVERLIKRAN